MVSNVEIVIEEQQRPDRVRLNHPRPLPLIGVAAGLDERAQMAECHTRVNHQHHIHEQRNLANTDYPPQDHTNTQHVLQPFPQPPTVTSQDLPELALVKRRQRNRRTQGQSSRQRAVRVVQPAPESAGATSSTVGR